MCSSTCVWNRNTVAAMRASSKLHSMAQVAAVNVADAAARWGYITPDGTYIDLRRNVHTIITATASANANVGIAGTPTAAAAA